MLFSGYEMKHSKREEGFDTFLTWLQENAVDTSAISIANFPEEGCGLKANRDITVKMKSYLHIIFSRILAYLLGASDFRSMLMFNR